MPCRSRSSLIGERHSDGLADHEPPAGTEHARELAQRGAGIGKLAKACREIGGVESSVGVGQPPAVAERCADVPQARRGSPRERLIK